VYRHKHINTLFRIGFYRLACFAVCLVGMPVLSGAQHIHYYICPADTFVYPKTSDGARYKINFGDGTIDSSYAPIKHIYAKTGNYVISIARTKIKTDSFTYHAHVGSLPSYSFTAKSLCSKVEFANFCPDTVIVNGGWEWDFGDGEFSTLKSPSHIYKSQGYYTVNLKYGTHSACNKIFSKLVAIVLPIDFGFSYHVNDNAALFHPRDSTAMHYHWDFGDKDTTDSIAPFHTYLTKGKYPVSLVTETKTGCVSYYLDTLSAGSTGIQPINANSNLFQAYPNPFSNTLVVHYELTHNRNVSLKLYDATGKLATTIVDEAEHAGRYDIEFHPADHGVKTGIYLLIAVFGEVYLSQRLVMQQ
jgi:PKD repeat protein